MSDARPNLPLPDQLAQVREQIKDLESREVELRKQLIDHRELRTGASWYAEVKTVTSNRVDIKELRAMHADLVEDFTFPNPVIQVVLKQITDDGEIITPKRRSISDESK